MRLPRGASLPDRFWSKAIAQPGCWGWRGALNPHGYGKLKLKVKGKWTSAHRVSWLVHHGDVPAGMCVLHRCDNPECSNPDHLFLGTQRDNALDREAKGRGNFDAQRPRDDQGRFVGVERG